MNTLVSTQVQHSLDQLKRQFAQAEPFKHVVIDDFLSPEFCCQLQASFPAFDDKKAVDENGVVGKKSVHESVVKISPAYKKLDQMIKGTPFINMIEQITGIPGLKYDPYYFGGGTHENQHGQELDPHVDFTHHPISGQHRRLNLIIYLNDHWEAEWGGSIEFHRNPKLPRKDDFIISELPLFNKAVLFETNNISWHGFPQINLPKDKQHLTRKSFALYYYTDLRDSQVQPHSTIYVERPLPDHFKTGLTLNDADEAVLKSSIERRDQHIERLYHNVTALMKQVDELKREALRQQHQGKSSVLDELIEQGDFNAQHLLKKIHDMEQSTSWRITRPLRRFKRWLKRR